MNGCVSEGSCSSLNYPDSKLESSLPLHWQHSHKKRGKENVWGFFRDCKRKKIRKKYKSTTAGYLKAYTLVCTVWNIRVDNEESLSLCFGKCLTDGAPVFFSVVHAKCIVVGGAAFKVNETWFFFDYCAIPFCIKVNTVNYVWVP